MLNTDLILNKLMKSLDGAAPGIPICVDYNKSAYSNIFGELGVFTGEAKLLEDDKVIEIGYINGTAREIRKGEIRYKPNTTGFVRPDNSLRIGIHSSELFLSRKGISFSDYRLELMRDPIISPRVLKDLYHIQ